MSSILTERSLYESQDDSLNGRVFFWLHPRKLERLLSARRYRNYEQDVLTVDTRSLVESYEPSIRLSPMNSGATLWASAPHRGSDTFQPIGQYPFADRRRGHSLMDAVTELSVVGGVPDLAGHVLGVGRYRGPVQLEELYSAQA